MWGGKKKVLTPASMGRTLWANLRCQNFRRMLGCSLFYLLCTEMSNFCLSRIYNINKTDQYASSVIFALLIVLNASKLRTKIYDKQLGRITMLKRTWLVKQHTVKQPMRLCSKGLWKARGSPHQSKSSVAALWKFAGFCKCWKRTKKTEAVR